MPHKASITGQAVLDRLAAEGLPETPEHYRRMHARLCSGEGPKLPEAHSLAPCMRMLGMVEQLLARSRAAGMALGEAVETRQSGLNEALVQLRSQLSASADTDALRHPLRQVLGHIEGLRVSLAQAQAALDESRRSQEILVHELQETGVRLNEDPLTGLTNRCGLDQALEREIARARRQSCPLAVALVDLDHFRLLNDQLGHRAGDELLVHFSALCKTLLRKSDQLIRYVGDEFAMILPDTPLAGAQVVIERLRTLNQALPLEIDGQPVATTFSAGITALAGPEDSWHTLFHRVEGAMLDAKKNGRDQLRLG